MKDFPCTDKCFSCGKPHLRLHWRNLYCSHACRMQREDAINDKAHLAACRERTRAEAQERRRAKA